MKGAVALIAGSGSLPVEFLKRAKKKRLKITVISIKGERNPEAEKSGYPVYHVSLANFGSIIDICRKNGINKILMLGYVRHTTVIMNILDPRVLAVLMKLPDKSAESILGAAIAEFKKAGIETLPTTYLLDDYLAKKGFIAGRVCCAKEMKNIKFGFKMAKALAGLDIGQTVVINNGIVMAAEAQEGTDKCIERGARFAGKGFIVAKAARPRQDLRYDMPVIGVRTIRLIKHFGGKGIAIEAGKTFMLEKENLIKEAEKQGVFIYGV